MRITTGALVLVLAVASAHGQEAPSLDRPSPNGTSSAETRLSGDPGSGYTMEQGMTAPKIVQAVAAVYPEDEPVDGRIKRSLLSMTVSADGVPLFVHIVHSAGEQFDAAAISAVKQSKFQAGLRDQKAVPIRTIVRVSFTPDHAPAVPEVMKRTYAGAEDGVVADFHPEPAYKVEPEFSDEARKKKISGNVLVTLLVTEEGMPLEVRVARGLGYGLDEKAVECVRQWRFKPAMKDGKAVPQHIYIEINFQRF